MSRIFDILIINTILSSVIILFVLLSKGILKNKIKPTLVSLLWVMALIRLLMPYSIESPINIWNIIPERKPAEEETATVADVYMPMEYTMEGDTNIPVGTAEYEPSNIVYDVPTPSTASKPTVLQKIKNVIKSIDIPALSASIWIAAALGILGLNIIKMIIFAFYQKGAKLADTAVNEAFKRAKAKLGIQSTVGMLISHNTEVPIAYSLLSPRILIPENMLNHMDKEKIELILMHELMHIRRLDILKNYLWLAAKAIYWFNPLVWIGHRQYISDTEICCDYHVMKKLNKDEKIHYSQSLLDAAKLINKKPVCSAPYMFSFCESETKLRRRIMNILNPIKQSKKKTITLSILITMLAVCCFTTACQQPNTTQDASIAPTPSPTPLYAGTDAQGNPIYYTVPPMIENTGEPTPTPQIIDFDSDGNPITATYSPGATPDPFAFDDAQGKTITNSKDGLDMIVNFSIKHASRPSPGSFITSEIETVPFSLDIAKKAAEFFMGDVYYSPILTKSDYKKLLHDYEEYRENSSLSDQDKKDDDYYEFLKNGIEDSADENKEKEIAFENGHGSEQIMTLKSYTDSGSMQTLNVENSPEGNYSLHYTRDYMSKSYLLTGDWFHGYSSPTPNVEYFRWKADDAVFYLHGYDMRNVYSEKAVVINNGDSWSSYDELIAQNSNKECYAYYYVPVVDYTPCVYGNMAKGYDKAMNEEAIDYSLCEYIRVVVDEDGVLDFYWHNPQEILSQTQQNAVPISISDAIDMFEKNIWDSDAFNDDSSVSSIITIHQIEFRLVPKMHEDGSIRLVSAYVFLGNQMCTRADGKEVNISDSGGSDSFMLVDALTGEVIDFYN